MNLRTDVILSVAAVLLVTLAGTGVRAAELTVQPDGPAGIPVDSSHLAAAPAGEPADSPHLAAAVGGEPVDTPHLAATAADTPHLPAAQPAEVEITDHPTTPKELLARMAKAREAIRTVQLRAPHTFRVDRAVVAHIGPGAARGPVPSPDWSVTSFDDRLWLDGRRWRCEGSRLGTPTVPYVTVSACDGVLLRSVSLEGPVNRVRSAAGAGIWDRVLPDSQGEASIPQGEASMPSEGSIMAAPGPGRTDVHMGSPLTEFHYGFWIHPLAETLGRTSLQGPDADSPCYRLIVEVATHKYTYYVRPEYGWAPVRMTLEIVDASPPGVPQPGAAGPAWFPPHEREWEIRYEREESGLWYPHGWTRRHYDGHGPGRRMWQESVWTVESVELNGPLADELFTLEFPDGVSVTDYTRGGVTVAWDSRLGPDRMEGLFSAAYWEEQAKRLQEESVQRRRGTRAPQVGERVPPFEVTALDGSPAVLAELRGKWVVLMFWNSGQPNSLAELPPLKTLHERFAPTSRLQIVGLDLGPDAELLKAVVEEHELAWTQVWLGGGPWGSMWAAWDMTNMRNLGPVFCLVDPDGYVETLAAEAWTIVNAVHRALAEPENESTP
jgi:hypothetical protein